MIAILFYATIVLSPIVFAFTMWSEHQQAKASHAAWLEALKKGYPCL